MHGASPPRPFAFLPAGPLRGRVRVPGDKSVSHRSLMFAALAVGESRITGLLEGEDVLATAAAMRAMGASIERGEDGEWRVHGVGVGGLLQPAGALDMGNSGTSTRLLMGLVASHALTVTFTGDASLSKRPMNRVIEPLSRIGAEFTAYPGGRLPLTVRGIVPAVPITYRLPIASAQVKSAVLLAGLNTPGLTRVEEPVPTRDHSERMLAGFGADISVEQGPDARIITLRGEAELRPCDVAVPGDPSSAAFWLLAGTIVPGSELVVEDVLLNPTRIGFVEALRLMGADLTVEDERDMGGERVGSIRVRHAALTGIDVPPDLAPSMIDEYPALFVAAAYAKGTTRALGAEELRVKESDRVAAMAAALRTAGVPSVEEHPDGLVIQGTGGDPLPGGGRVETLLDHRIAMASAILGLHATSGLEVDDARPIATSYPDFLDTARRLGAPANWLNA